MTQPDVARPPDRKPERGFSPGAALLVAIWIGLLTGWIEVIGLGIRHATSTPIMELSPQFVWTVPTATTAMALLAGVAALLVVSIRWDAPTRSRGVVFAAVAFATAELLLLFIPRFYDVVVLLLGLGVATQVSAAIAAHPRPVTRAARRTALPLLALIVLLGAGRQARQSWKEHRGLDRLPPAGAGQPDIIVITLDAVRAADVSLYGYPRETTPALAKFAERGVVFEHALTAAPWTLPSHATMFTGRWHHELSADYTVPLDGTYPTIAEVLQADGYATGAVVANLRYCGYESGLDRGFLHYDDYPVSLGAVVGSSRLLRRVLDNFRLRRLVANDQHLVRKSAADVNRAALAWIDDIRDRPFFLFLNYFDAHEPYLPPSPFDTRFGPGRERGKFSPLHRWLWEPAVAHDNMGPAQIREEHDAYDGAIAYLDSQLDSLFAALERRGRLANTIVVVTADHGEEFAEHRVFEHGYSLYRPSVEVPLVVVAPGRAPGGARVGEPVSLRDLAATLADLAGAGSSSPITGTSFATAWQDSRPGDSSPILSEVHAVSGHPDWFPVSRGDLWAVLHHGLRYIRGPDGSEQLFDFELDPWEKHDLAGESDYQARLPEYRALLDSALSTPAR